MFDSLRGEVKFHKFVLTQEINTFICSAKELVNYDDYVVCYGLANVLSKEDFEDLKFKLISGFDIKDEYFNLFNRKIELIELIEEALE